MSGDVPATGNGRAPPLAGRRWLRLMLVTVSCLVCAGVLPGAALFVQLFVDAGIGASACEGGLPGCDKQQISVSAAFNSAASLTFFGILLVGFVYDRIGGKSVSQIGAALVCVGFAVLQVSLLGARYGYDAQTSGCLVWGLIITDAGAILNSFCLYSFVWHFQDYQTFVIAVVNSTNSGTAMLPNLLSWFMNQTGVPLYALFLAWTGFIAVAFATCRCLVPTMAEYRAEAKKVLGFPLPRADRQPFCQALKDAHAVLRPHWGRHVLYIISAGTAVNSVLMYSSLSGDYGQIMFKSKEAGEELAKTQTILISVCSIFLAPIMTFVGDNWGHGMHVLLVTVVVSCAASSLTVATPTWPAQELASLFAAVFFTLYQTVAGRYAVAFAMPNRFGVLVGTLVAYMMIVCMTTMAGTYYWISSLPRKSLEHLSLPLQGASWIGTTAMLVFTAYFMCVGLPAMPVVLAKDEAEISLAFGCTNFDEVARATGVKDRKEVVQILRSTDSKAFKDLLKRVDYSRIEQSPAAAAAPSTAAVHDVERGPESTKPLPSPAQPEAEQSPTAAMVTEEAPLAQTQPLLLPKGRPGEVTVCALTCDSGGSQSRLEWTASPMGILFGCCAAAPRRDNLEEILVPLLAQEQASASASLVASSDHSSKVRAQSIKAMDLLRSKNKEGLMHMYETEDPQLLWDSYLDTQDMLSQVELEKAEEEFDELIPQDEFMELPLKRPELRILFAKMMAHKVKEAAFGR